MVPLTGRPWAIVLAGGEGTRLAPLTRHISGRDCPKQFCAVAGSRSLLAETLARISPAVPPERTVVVGHCAQADLLRRELPGPMPQALLQPANKGTAAAILWPTLCVAARDPAAVLAVFPSDHFVRPQRAFLTYLRRAFRMAIEQPELVVLLGMAPDAPDEGYGWIERGEPLPDAPGCFRVRGFWEKPAAEEARRFFHAGFLWNSLIIVARATALRALGWRCVPDVAARLARISRPAEGDNQRRAVEAAYADMSPRSFSRDVLERRSPSLAVLPVRDILWSDWGTPERVVRTLGRIGASPSWLEGWLARSA